MADNYKKTADVSKTPKRVAGRFFQANPRQTNQTHHPASSHELS